MSQSFIDPRYLDVVRGFPAEAQMLWAALMNHRHQLVPGLLSLPIEGLAAERGLKLPIIRKGLSRLVDQQLVDHDPTALLFRMPLAPSFYSKPGPTHIQGWYRHWMTTSESRLKYDHVASLRAVVPWEGKSPVAEVWAATFGQSEHISRQIPPKQLSLLSPVPGYPIEGDIGIPPHKEQEKKKDQDPEQAAGGKVVQLHTNRDIAIRLWSLQNQMRQEINPRTRGLVATDKAIKAVVDILEAGYSEDDCVHVLSSYAAEARAKGTIEWFNGETNWIEKNFRRTLGRDVGAGSGRTEPRAAAEFKPGRQRL